MTRRARVLAEVAWCVLLHRLVCSWRGHDAHPLIGICGRCGALRYIDGTWRG